MDAGFLGATRRALWGAQAQAWGSLLTRSAHETLLTPVSTEASKHFGLGAGPRAQRLQPGLQPESASWWGHWV